MQCCGHIPLVSGWKSQTKCLRCATHRSVARRVHPRNGCATMSRNTCPLICSHYADDHAAVVNKIHTINHPWHGNPSLQEQLRAGVSTARSLRDVLKAQGFTTLDSGGELCPMWPISKRLEQPVSRCRQIQPKQTSKQTNKPSVFSAHLESDYFRFFYCRK